MAGCEEMGSRGDAGARKGWSLDFARDERVVEWPHHSPVTPAQAGVSRGRVHKMPACAGMTVRGMGRSTPAPLAPSAVEARSAEPSAPKRHPEPVSGSISIKVIRSRRGAKAAEQVARAPLCAFCVFARTLLLLCLWMLKQGLHDVRKGDAMCHSFASPRLRVILIDLVNTHPAAPACAGVTAWPHRHPASGAPTQIHGAGASTSSTSSSSGGEIRFTRRRGGAEGIVLRLRSGRTVLGVAQTSFPSPQRRLGSRGPGAQDASLRWHDGGDGHATRKSSATPRLRVNIAARERGGEGLHHIGRDCASCVPVARADFSRRTHAMRGRVAGHGAKLAASPLGAQHLLP